MPVEVGTGVADRPVQRVVLFVVRAGDPRGTAAVLVRFAAPRLGARLAGGRDRVGFPYLVACIGVERDDPAAHAVLGARGAGDDLAAQRQRHDREALGVGVVANLLVPDDLTGRVAERDDVRIQGGEVDLVLVHRHAAVDHVAAEMRIDVAGQLPLVLPEDLPARSVERPDAVER